MARNIGKPAGPVPAAANRHGMAPVAHTSYTESHTQYVFLPRNGT